MNDHPTEEVFAIQPTFTSAADQLTRMIMAYLVSNGVLETPRLLDEFVGLYTGIAQTVARELPRLDAINLVRAYRDQISPDDAEARYIRIGREVSEMMGGKDRSINLLMTLLRQTADKIRRDTLDQ